MRDEFRDRFFTPFVMPLTIIGLLLVIGLSLSRVLLAIPELGASIVALLAAGYIMAMAFVIEARTRITARTLGVALAIGLISVIAAGAVATAAGMRPIGEHGAEGGEEHGGEGGGEGAAAAAVEPVFRAIDIAYEEAPETLPTGEVELVLINEGTIEHNVVFEELGADRVLDAAGGETDQMTVTLEAGQLTYFCDVAGHREAGMEGTLTVSDTAEAGGGEPAPDAESDGAPGGATEAGSEPGGGATGG